MTRKREQIKRALEQLCPVEQMIVIENIHIEHRDISAPLTVVTCKGRTLKTKVGYYGIPGEALAIIIPRRKEK